jgi:hypothetical protein
MVDYLSDIIKISISGILVFLTAYFMLQNLLKNEEKKRYYEMRKETIKTLNPVRLNAYERFALFLERINPDSLILRMQLPGMTVADLHLALLTAIREEFEHNVSQQIYISPELWLFIKNAKESLVQFINNCYGKIPDDLPAIELAKVILEGYNSIENPPTEVALEFLKKEVRAAN